MQSDHVPHVPRGKILRGPLGTCTARGCASLACGFAFVDACDDCTQAQCCASLLACSGIPACVTMTVCMAACGINVFCQNSCVAAAGASAANAFIAATTCVNIQCAAECDVNPVPPSGAGGASTGSGTLPNGCPTAEPIACGGNLCCPNEFPVCNGDCGRYCCPSAQTTTG